MPYPHSHIPDTDKEFIPPKERSVNKPGRVEILKHSALFIITFLFVTFFGIIWVGQDVHADTYLGMWREGALFAALLLGFLAAHEFGHYFAAVYHNVKVSLPYFIPIPIGIGTMGAVIKIKEQIKTTTKLFDVGIAGPIAGFIVSILILLYGFTTLPDPTFIENFSGHDEVLEHIYETGTFPEEAPIPDNGVGVIILGDTLLFTLMASFFENVPPMYEMYHYPFLFAGWLGLFFTALNLMPLGQLDGGHILYSLLGYRKHQQVARVCFGGLTTLAGIEAIPFLYQQFSAWIPGYEMSSTIIWALVLFYLMRKAFHRSHVWIAPMWALSLVASIGYLYFIGGGMEEAGSLIWIFWSFFVVYLVKIEHPPVLFEQPLSPNRRLLGWISMIVFILCISPSPISVIS